MCQLRLASLVALFCLCASATALAAPDPVQISSLSLAEDPSAMVGPEAVQTGALAFKPLEPGRHRFEPTDSALWLRLQVSNSASQSMMRMLEVGQARLHEVSLYARQNGGWHEEHGGTARPFSTREFPTLTQVFALDLPAQSRQEFLVRVASGTVMIIQPRLWTTGELMTVENHNTQREFFMAGAVVLMLSFGLVVMLILREPGFLVFGLASLCFLLFRWSIKGVAFREFWPDSPQWALQSIGFFLALVGMLLWVLHRMLLRTAEHFPRLDKVMIAMAISFACLAVSVFIAPYRPLMEVMSIWGLSISLFSPVLGFMAWRQGVVLGGYALAAYTLPFQITQILYFSSIGWLPPLPALVTDNAMAVAMVLASVVMLAGLGARMAQLRREKQQLENQQRKYLEILVTERTAELSQAKEVAEQALANQRQFLAMVSHELRSPVASVSSACALLEARNPETHPDKVVLRIRRAVKRMSAFMDNLMAEDRFASRNWEVRHSWVALQPLLNSILEQGQLAAPNHALSLKTQGLPRQFYLDPDMVRILLLNLLENAAKYAGTGTPIILFAHWQGRELVLDVMDEGPGFTEEEKTQVFKKYTRGCHAGVIPGTGLGLYIVDRIVALHEGQVQLKNRSSGGGLVHIRLPGQVRANRVTADSSACCAVDTG